MLPRVPSTFNTLPPCMDLWSWWLQVLSGGEDPWTGVATTGRSMSQGRGSRQPSTAYTLYSLAITGGVGERKRFFLKTVLFVKQCCCLHHFSKYQANTYPNWWGLTSLLVWMQRRWGIDLKCFTSFLDVGISDWGVMHYCMPASYDLLSGIRDNEM